MFSYFLLKYSVQTGISCLHQIYLRKIIEIFLKSGKFPLESRPYRMLLLLVCDCFSYLFAKFYKNERWFYDF